MKFLTSPKAILKLLEIYFNPLRILRASSQMLEATYFTWKCTQYTSSVSLWISNCRNSICEHEKWLNFRVENSLIHKELNFWKLHSMTEKSQSVSIQLLNDELNNFHFRCHPNDQLLTSKKYWVRKKWKFFMLISRN